MLSEPPYRSLTDSIDKFPVVAETYYRRGQLLYSNNQLSLAESDFRKAWSLQKKEEYALSLTSILRQKNQDSALQFLQQALKQLPDNFFLQIGLARGYQQKKLYDSALTVCNTIILKYPNAIDALLLKSEILQSQNKNIEAIATLEKAYTYAPGDPELVHQLAFAYAEEKNPKVILLADSLIRADTEKRHAEPYYFKGVYYSNIANDKEAVKQFDEAISHDFNYLEAYLNKGIVYYDQKKYDEALSVFNLGISVDPSFPDFYYWLGKTYEIKKNLSEAQLNYSKAYGLDKTMVEAKASADRLSK